MPTPIRTRHRMTARAVWLLRLMQHNGVLVACDRGERDTLLRLYRYGDIERERTTDPAHRHFRYYLTLRSHTALVAVMQRRNAAPIRVRSWSGSGGTRYLWGSM